MSELNYLRIAQILGGKITEIQPPSFGVFGAAAASAERFRLITPQPEIPVIERSQYQDIVDAFEEVRHGYEPDRVLVDPALHKEFVAACRRRGIKAPDRAISKKLQAFRKASSYGVKLSPTTRSAGLDPEPFFYAAELGYVQMSYRRKISVDDIITEPKVGEEFVDLCKQIKPHGRAMDFKWAALRLRKMRSFTPKKMTKMLAFEAEEVEQNLRLVGTLDRVALTDVPTEKGIFTLAENNGTAKYLYVGATLRTLREAFEPFRTARPFMAVAGPFWQPTLADISLRVAPVKKQLLGVGPRDLSLRLIEERHPLFNMPVHFDEDDEKKAA